MMEGMEEILDKLNDLVDILIIKLKETKKENQALELKLEKHREEIIRLLEINQDMSKRP